MDTNRTLDEIEISLNKNNNNICGNCDPFCEYSLGNNGAKQDARLANISMILY